MQTVTIEQENALKAHKEASKEGKTLLENLLPGLFKKKKDWRDITSFDQVCEVAGEDPSSYIIPANATKRQRGTILFSMLQLISDVFKDGVVLDYNNTNQNKYYPWGEFKSGSGFSLGGVVFDLTDASVGARLCVDSREKAQHIWKHFNYIYQDYWQEL